MPGKASHETLQEVSERRLNRLLKRLEALSEGSVVVLEDFCELEDCWLSNSGLRLSRSPCTTVIRMSRLQNWFSLHAGLCHLTDRLSERDTSRRSCLI